MSKIWIDQATHEHAIALLELMKAEQPSRLKRWHGLERACDVVEEISAPVRKFVSDHVDVPHHKVKTRLFMAMREAIHQSIKRSNAVQ